MSDLTPVEGCEGCRGTTGRLGCLTHSPNVYVSNKPPMEIINILWEIVRLLKEIEYFVRTKK